MTSRAVGQESPLSFCLLTTFYPPYGFGGDAVHVHRLAEGLARRGHRVRVVHSRTAHRMLGGSLLPAAGPEPHDGVEVVEAPTGAWATTGTYLTGLPLGYRRQLDELAQGFDVVHFHNPSLLGGPGAFGLGTGIRLYTTHEHWLMCPTHVLFRYGKEVCERPTCWRCCASYRRPPQLWRSTSLLPRSLRHLDALLCPSRFTLEMHARSFPEARIELLPLPGPEGEEVVEPILEQTRRPFFLYAGRIEAIKGVDRLVRAFPRVRGADLVVAGDGTGYDELCRLAEGDDAVRLVGRLPHPEVLGLCRRARAVVVPSAGYETFGGVAVEAMALGTPVVVRDLGPLPELVETGGGRTFGDDDQLVSLLQQLADEPDEARRLGREARTIAAERFGTDLFFRRYFDIVADLARTSGREELATRAAAAAAAA